MLLQTAQPYNKRNRERNKDESFKGVDLFNARSCLYRESCVIKIKASLLACNIFASFSQPVMATMDITAKTSCVTYSCTSARDFHTVPF